MHACAVYTTEVSSQTSYLYKKTPKSSVISVFSEQAACRYCE